MWIIRVSKRNITNSAQLMNLRITQKTATHLIGAKTITHHICHGEKTTTNSNLVTKMDISIDSFCITLVTEKGFQNNIKTGMEVTY